MAVLAPELAANHYESAVLAAPREDRAPRAREDEIAVYALVNDDRVDVVGDNDFAALQVGADELISVDLTRCPNNCFILFVLLDEN